MTQEIKLKGKYKRGNRGGTEFWVPRGSPNGSSNTGKGKIKGKKDRREIYNPEKHVMIVGPDGRTRWEHS